MTIAQFGMACLPVQQSSGHYFGNRSLMLKGSVFFGGTLTFEACISRKAIDLQPKNMGAIIATKNGHNNYMSKGSVYIKSIYTEGSVHNFLTFLDYPLAKHEALHFTIDKNFFPLLIGRAR